MDRNTIKMKYFNVLIFFICMFLKVPDINGWAYRQILGYGFLSFLISLVLCKKYHISVGLCFLITSIYAIILSGIPQIGYEVVSSLMALLFFSCIAIGTDFPKFILPLLVFVSYGDAAIMIFKSLMNLNSSLPSGYWVLTNASLDASFVAVMSPIACMPGDKSSFKWAIRILLLAAVIFSKSNTAIAVFFGVWGIKFVMEKDWKRLGILVLSSLMILPGIYFYLGKKFADSEGRFHNWKFMMSFWQDHVNHWFGTGPGTYWVISQILQSKGAGSPVWVWMHNDFLEILFTQGYVGFIAILFLFSTMLFRSLKSPTLFSMIMGFAVISLTMFPLHVFVFQLLGIGLIHNCFHEAQIT